MPDDAGERRMLLRLAIDYEHESRLWWESGGQELWEAILESPDANDAILDEALARSWVSQAEGIEGWNAGPDYAPHPVTVQSVNDDVDL